MILTRPRRAPRIVSTADVVILHDNTDKLRGREGSESDVAVWETIYPLEESLHRLGHRSRRLNVGGGIPSLIKSLDASRPDLVFHLAETAFGKTLGESRLTALFEILGIAHTSSPPEALVICMDKLKTKAVLREMGISTPPHAVSFDGRLPNLLPMPPWISKPTLEDGSLGVNYDAVTSDPRRLARRVRKLHQTFRQPILIESFIDGREFNVGVVGEDVLPLVEIDFSGIPGASPRIVGYDSKWMYESAYFKGTTMICPAPVSASLRDRIHRLGKAALRAVNVSGYTRMDLRMDKEGNLYILEINPNPDLSPIAAMAKMAAVAGWGFDGLVDRILNFSLNRPSPV